MDIEGLTLEQKMELLATHTGLSVEEINALTMDAAKLSLQLLVARCGPLVEAHEAWLKDLKNFEPLLSEAVKLAEFVKALCDQIADVS